MKWNRSRAITIAITTLAITAIVSAGASAAYKPAEGPLMTKWAEQVSADNALPEYPRPQMAREKWSNLNGLWDYAITDNGAGQPETFDGKILVPFCAESALSGVMKQVGPDKRLWYSRTFEIPKDWGGKRVLLHFGAVDWDATVFVNGQQVAQHKGGFDPFSADITDALKPSGRQRIIVSVWDPTNAGSQPRGKQVRRPRGIWYTAVTGIWQTVWIEPVNDMHIRDLRITPDFDKAEVKVDVTFHASAGGYHIRAEAFRPDRPGNVMTDEFELGSNYPPKDHTRTLIVRTGDFEPWTPDSPFLYDLKLTLMQNGEVFDVIKSYFGMRKISLGKDENGLLRLCLNNKPLFQYGPLDQGWWPDGLYTAPTDEALAYDIKVTKELGCNMLRKHVKVEPDRLYYHCDKMGLLVWQDMPSADNKTPESREQFELEWKRIMAALHNHPSIVMWVPFNEGWGQHDTERYVQLTKKWDPSRLVNNASGWTDKNCGDVHDMHNYPGPGMPPVEESRAAVLGEFGGLGLPLAGHTWQDQANWGYRSYTDREALTRAYVSLINNLRALIGKGLAAAVYTQTTDVEIEVNGWMTYDRAVIKPDAHSVYQVNSKLYLPPPIVRTVVPAAQDEPVQWKYTTDEPADGWAKTDFDDSAWKTGPAGFGTEGTPGSVVRTQWNGSDIWLRRSFELDTDPANLSLTIHHDEDAQVFINGVKVADLTGYTTSYSTVYLSDKDVKAFKKGANTIAIHCHQTGGGQYIDAGIVSVRERD